MTISPASGQTDLNLSAGAFCSLPRTAPAHAPQCATPSRTFPSSTSVNHIAGYDKLLRGFVNAFYHFISLILVFIVFAVNLLAAAQSASCSLLGNGVCETLPSQGRGCHLSLQQSQQNAEHLQCHQQGPTQTADPSGPTHCCWDTW